MFSVDPTESEDWVKLRVFSMVEGYAYNTTDTAPKIAIWILLTDCLFVISHHLRWYLGNFIHLLGFHCRSHCPSSQFDPYDCTSQHLRWYHGA